MSFDNSELLNDFVIEANEHLAEIENQLLEIEANGANVNVDLVNTVFRAIHSIKGAAGFLGLSAIGSLSHSLENVLNLIRAEELTPTAGIVDVMLKSADQLSSLVEDVNGSNDIDVSVLSSRLDLIADNLGLPGDAGAETAAAEDPEVEAAEKIVEQIADIQPTVDSASTPAAEAAPAEEEAEDEMDRQIRLAFEARDREMAEQRASQTESGATTKPPKSSSPAATAVAKPEPKTEPVKAEPKQQVESSIRVAVSVLDQLMNLAGELVLARNQLLQTVNGSAKNVADKTGRNSGIEAVTASIDQVTSELQEAIMQTRMQPIGTVFNRFPRVVRDLSSKLQKQIDLQMEGVEVEVDKTIVEAIGDPLTHLVRNSVDHGVETPGVRESRGKNPTGKICLRAYHQAGKVRIDIEDDGGGIDPDIIRVKALEKGVISEDQMDRITDRDAVRLIFHPGFSTAAKVTDISGRGVGMDVVKTNIEKLGGTVDVESVVGVGTTIRVTLPLTLAIVPSLIVESGGDRYAIPQSSIVELVRVRTSEFNEKIGRVKNAEVLRLRGNLLPLVRLSDALNLDETRRKSKLKKPKTELLTNSDGGPEDGQTEAANVPRAINIVVVEATQFRYGLVVDALHESEEIVVKPLGTHLREIQSLAGATILGDGHIALILDVGGIASHRELTTIAEEARNESAQNQQKEQHESDKQLALLFSNHPTEQFAIPMSVITRIERTTLEDIDDIGGDLLMRYRGGSLPLLALSRLVNCKPPVEQSSLYVVVFEVNGIEIGLIAPELSDIRELSCKIDSMVTETAGVMGTFVLDNQTTRYLNLYDLAEKAHPNWFIEQREDVELSPSEFKLLLVEDSSFFRRQVKKFIKSEGFQIVEAEDGVDGWNKLNEANGSISLVVSDIEMPNMNGFELCSRMREDNRFNKLPVIALTSLSDPADVERGRVVGFNDYQVKMDKASLISSIHNLLKISQQQAVHA